MARFTVILPEGSVLLKNTETGETLTLSANSGPLTLGELEMTLTPAPEAFKAQEESVSPNVTPISQTPRTTDEWVRTLPPGFGPNAEEPFLSPAEGEEAAVGNPDRPFIRVLDAPMDALVSEDFERTIQIMALQRNNMEGEIEFLEEIEADPDDIEELRKALEKLDINISAVVTRKIEFEEFPKRYSEI